MSAPAKRFRIGLVGARGYVGSELIRLLAAHPVLELAYVGSRERDGLEVKRFEPTAPDGLHYGNLGPLELVREALDVVVLALPNGLAAPWAEALARMRPETLLLDLSADYRFDPDWYYGLPELTRRSYARQRRISNPGCYATAMQLAVAPMRDALAGAVQCFGVSGYSGAGTSPSDKNDPLKLKDNLMPYSLAGHIHEREVAAQMACDIQFMPHVAPHFRGLSITANLPLARAFALDEIRARYAGSYGNEPLVEVSDAAPWTSAVAGTPKALVGGFTLSADGRRLVVVSVLDNLLKGAASQALQNINLGLGLPETTGIL